MRHAIALLLLSAGCAGSSPDDSESTEQPVWDHEPSDQELWDWAAHHDFGAIVFMDCVSKSTTGPTLTAEPLKVGNGRFLECRTYSEMERHAGELVDSKGEVCILGRVRRSSVKLKGDDRLALSLAAAPTSGPWTVRATHEGGEIEIHKAEGWFGARMWPIWVEAAYQPLKLERLKPGGSCDAQLGL